MASEQLDAALRCWEEGDLAEAATLFRQIAATGDPQASHLLACLLEQQGDLDGAEAAHRSVILSGDPVYGQRSAIQMGMMLVNAEEYGAAHRVLMIASEGADFEVAALADTALVLVLTQLGDAQGAAEALERARRCDSPAVAELAAELQLPDFDTRDTFDARGRYELADTEEDYRELLTCGDPEVVSLSAFRLYRLHAERGEFEAARQVCEHAIAVGHSDHLAMARKLLGAVLVDLGEYAEAAAAYRAAAEDPRPELRLPSLIELAKVIAQLGDQDETRALFHRVIASGQREYATEARACLAQMHAEAGEVQEAAAAVRAVLEEEESEWASSCVMLLSLLPIDEVIDVVRLAAEHPDTDVSFKAQLLLQHAAMREPLADPEEEQALQDADQGLALLREGEVDEARRLLRKAADSAAPEQSARAMVALAELEIGQGDLEQADELLAYVAEGGDSLQSFTAAFLLHLLRTGDGVHPVLGAIVDHQRLGRQEGLSRYREAAEHSAVGAAVFAQMLASTGYDLSEARGLVDVEADPLTLSYTAATFKDLDLLRRAHAEGHPVLAPWVAQALGELTEDDAEARAALTVALESGRQAAAMPLLETYERQGDLLAAARLHERLGNAWLLGFTRIRLDDLDGAALAMAEDEFAARLLAQDPIPAESWQDALLALECAHAWQRAGRTVAAGTALSLVTHPDLEQQAACYLGALRDEAGDARGAIEAWQRAAAGEDEGMRAVALRGLGHVRLGLGEHDAAAAAFLALHELEGDEQSALQLGRALVAGGRAGEARQVLDAALGEAAPLYLAVQLREAGDLEAAVATAETAAAGASPELAGESARILGGLLARTGDLAGARAAFERAAALDPDAEPATLLEAGRALAEAGDAEAARSAHLRVAAQDRDQRAAAVARARLGTADPEERPWALLADGRREAARQALAERSGQAMADLLIALEERDAATVRVLLEQEPSEEAFDAVLETGAEPFYRLAAELAGPRQSALGRLGLGALLAQDGHHSRAELALLPVTGCAEPDLVTTAWAHIAAVRQARGDLDGAVEALRKAMPEAAVDLARLLDERGDTEGARTALIAGTESGDLESRRHLLVHLLLEEDHEAVAAEADRAVATGDQETVAFAYWVWGDACRASGDVHGAVAKYRAALDTGFPLPALRADLAEALYTLGETAEAHQEARLAMESGDPDAVGTAGQRLGGWLQEEGDPLAAAEAYAAAGTQQAAEGLAALAYQAYERGEHTLAAQVLSLGGERGADRARELGELCDDPEAVRLYYRLVGSDPFTEMGLAERLAELGETGQARAMLERLQDHHDADVRFVAGGKLLSLLDSEGDAEAFSSVVERQAGDADSPAGAVFGSLLGMIQGRQGDTEASLRTLREAAESGEPAALSVLGQALIDAGEVAEGRQVLLRVVDGDDPDLAGRAMLGLGITYRDEDEAQARDWYLKALESIGPLAAMYLGALAKRARDFPEALTWYQRVIDAGHSESGMAAAHLGELCYWLGDRDGALRYYELTLSLTDQPDLVAEAACRLGEIRHERGDLALAVRMLEIAVDTGDETFAPEAAGLLGRISRK